MSARPLAALAALSFFLSAACAQASTPTPPTDSAEADGHDHSAGHRPDMLATCEDTSDWSAPGPAYAIFGNVYHVGTCTITVLLVTSPEGHILIDAATEEAVPTVLENIRSLGFDPHDVRWLLSTHEHFDHSGGLAMLKEATGAQVAANAAAVAPLQSGIASPDDPQAAWLPVARPVIVDRILSGGDTVQVGDVVLTMHATPGHAPGSSSWTWTSCEGETCHQVAFADSVSVPAPDTYRFSDNPQRVAQFRRAMDVIAAMPCDLLLTPHPAQSQMYERYAGQSPLVVPGACANYARTGNANLDARLAQEAQARQ
jgi:metallo-beta-lactamase class B